MFPYLWKFKHRSLSYCFYQYFFISTQNIKHMLYMCRCVYVWLYILEIYPNFKKILKFSNLWLFKTNKMLFHCFSINMIMKINKIILERTLYSISRDFPRMTRVITNPSPKIRTTKKSTSTNLTLVIPFPFLPVTFFLVMSYTFRFQSFGRHPSPKLDPSNNPCWPCSVQGPSQALLLSWSLCGAPYVILVSCSWSLRPFSYSTLNMANCV